jgi:hypothetical protein
VSPLIVPDDPAAGARKFFVAVSILGTFWIAALIASYSANELALARTLASSFIFPLVIALCLARGRGFTTSLPVLLFFAAVVGGPFVFDSGIDRVVRIFLVGYGAALIVGAIFFLVSPDVDIFLDSQRANRVRQRGVGS